MSHALPVPKASAELLEWLLVTMRPMSRTRVKEQLRIGRILVNGQPVTRHDHQLQPGDRIEIAREPLAKRAEFELPIIYQDDSIVVIDKPPGLLSVATESEKEDTAFARLRAFLETQRLGRPFVVHRLDRETSGLLLFALCSTVREELQRKWSEVQKSYLAVIEGIPSPAEGKVEDYLIEGRDLRVRSCNNPGQEARKAITEYRVVVKREQFSLVEVLLRTGRKHQIRVHMSGLGCPVTGDIAYGARNNPAGRLGLHAWRLRLDHPVTGQVVELESPLPSVLQNVVGGNK